jgi:hypothetical protein
MTCVLLKRRTHAAHTAHAAHLLHHGRHVHAALQKK